MRKDSGAFPVRIEARFSFFAVLGLLICADREGGTMMCVLSCLLHELGHLAVMLFERHPPERIVLYGGGIHIKGGSTDFAAVIAGIAVNLMLFAAFGLPPWDSRELRLFGVTNLLIAAVNLLPIGELDGKLMLDMALTRAFRPERAVRISEVCERLIFVLMIPSVILLVFSGSVNVSAVIFLIYISAVEIFEKV